jgi:hypothetical protein
MNKLRIATIGVLTVALLLPGAVFAQEESPERHERGKRAAGEISGVVPGQGTFTLMTRQGQELEFQTDENTKFRGPGGSVEGIHDLKKGMKALVVAAQWDDGTLLALMVANADDQTFALQTREGETLSFQTGERTKYRGEGVDNFDDLESGMFAMVAAIHQDSGPPLALLIAAGEPKERPEAMRLQGEITGVVPGQGTFTIVNREGNEFELSTNDRTKFHSWDGSISDIHDLKKGMQAIVGAIRQDDGQLLALAVAAGNPEDRPGRPVLDVTVGGKVIEMGSSSFTIQTRNGDSISFSVNDSTHYKGISGFNELKVGMMAAVGADETDDGLLALFVEARNPDDRPEGSPQDRPEGRPDPRGPGQGQGQDEEISA